MRWSARYSSSSARPRLSAARRRSGLAPQPLGQRRPLAPPASRAHPDERLVEEVAVLEAPRRLLARDHRQIDVAAGHQPHARARVGGDDLEAHRRLLVEQVAQHRGQQPLAEVVAGRHPQRGGGAAGQLGELAEGGLGRAPQLAHDGQRRLAGGGEAHAAPGALEELDAEVRLQPPDLLADRGGGDVPLARGRAHGARARHREQGLQRGEEGGVDHEAQLNISPRTFHWTTQCPMGQDTPAPRRRRSRHGTHAARQGVGSAHGPDAAVRPDPAPDRPAPHPRGDDAAGLPDAEGAEAQGAHARAHLRHARSHHPHDGSGAALRRSHGGGNGRAHVPEHEGLRPEPASTWRRASRGSCT